MASAIAATVTAEWQDIICASAFYFGKIYKGAYFTMSGYDEAIDYTNLRIATEKCLKGNRWKCSIQSFEMLKSQYLADLHYRLRSGTYTPLPTDDFYLLERGKVRYIRAHHIMDRVWYKSWCEHDLKPLVSGRIMDNNSASQKGKGIDHSISLFRQALCSAYKKWGKDFYIVTTDYHDYFGSIPHSKILENIQFEDPRSQHTLKQYLELFPGGRGIGIGGEPSQIIAIVYPSSVDRSLACNCNVFKQGRYMDDSWFLCHTKEDAKHALHTFYQKSEELGLVVNEKRTQMHHMSQEKVTWLKKRVWFDNNGKIVMQLVSKNLKLRRATTKKHYNDVQEGRMPKAAAFESIRCWASYAFKYNSYFAIKEELEFFGQLFSVPDFVMHQLLCKHNSGWLKMCEALSLF